MSNGLCACKIFWEKKDYKIAAGWLERVSRPDSHYLEAQFFLWLESGYFNYMRGFLEKDLGIRCLILATADHSHRNTGYPLLLATSGFHAVDGHDYWQHPWERKVKAPMVDDPTTNAIVMIRYFI